MSNSAVHDHIIIGAGIAGLSAAYHFAKDGHSVVVLEATDGKSGASFASTAEMNHDPDAKWEKVVERFGIEGAREVWELSDFAMEKLADFAHRPGEEHFGTERLPAHLFSYKDGDAGMLRGKYEFYKSIGANAEFTENGSALHESFKAVLTIRDEGATNNQMILKELAHGMRELGGEIHHHRRAVRIEESADAVRVETESGELVSGRSVLIATGDGRGLVPKDLLIGRIRTFVIAYEKHGMRDIFRDSLMWDTDEPFHYVRPFDHTRLWVGGEDADESAYDPKDEKEKYAALEDYSKNVLHVDDAYKRDGQWSGVFFPSDRGLPYIGEVPGSRIRLSLGFGGSGILTSFISGYLHAAWLRGELPEYRRLFAVGW